MNANGPGGSEGVCAVTGFPSGIATRFDFKGVKANFQLTGELILMSAEQEFQLRQMMDILRQIMVKRKVDRD